MDEKSNINIFIDGELINLDNTPIQKLEKLLNISSENKRNLNKTLNSLLTSI